MLINKRQTESICRFALEIVGRLFQVIVEIAGDAFVEVHHVVSHHIVSVARVNEVVGLRASVFTFSEEGEAVLEHASRVVVAHDNLQASLEVFGLVEQVAAFIASGFSCGVSM